MQEDCLKITMFGTFAMEYGERALSMERNDRTKTNQLLQRLVCERSGVAREQLWHDLFEHENVADPSNSLRALLFRLRKSLKEQGLPGEEYIHIRKRTYYFEPECPVECDVHQFEDAWESAQQASEENQRLQYLAKACELYTGEFLPGLGAVDWVVVLNVKYKKMYVSSVKELCKACAERKEYKSMLEYASKAATIYPFDGWQSYQMEALIALNCLKEAIQLYEKTEKLMFEELGVALPESMVNMMADLGKQVRNKTDLMGDVLCNLQETGAMQGAYECSYPNFAECYHMISRMIDRTGQTAWLLLCTVTDGKGYALNAGERLEALQEELRTSIKKTLRRGDMFTRYSENQYLLLLLGIKQEDCEKVVARINANLENTGRQKYYNYHIAPVVGPRREKDENSK